MAIWIIEATKLKFEARCDLQGQIEVTMASEATNMAVEANMHMDLRVIEIADYKSDTKFYLRLLRLFGGHHGLRSYQIADMQTYVGAINVSDFKYEVKLNLDIITVARESIGPLPSSFASSQPRS